LKLLEIEFALKDFILSGSVTCGENLLGPYVVLKMDKDFELEQVCDDLTFILNKK
jgi:hypothetical protein